MVYVLGNKLELVGKKKDWSNLAKLRGFRRPHPHFSTFARSKSTPSTFMRLTSALPPQFLLPSWGTRKSYQALQQAHRALQPAQKCPYSSDRKPLKKREGGTVNLFEELFPEYKKQIERKGGDTELEKLPPFQWDGEAVVDSGAPKAAERGSGGERIPLFKDDVADHGREIPKKSSPNNLKSETDLSQHGGRTSRVLILNCASKTLEESDFHRVSPKGQHIQGWTGGIRKGKASYQKSLPFYVYEY